MNTARKRAHAARVSAFAVALVATHGFATAQSAPACASIATPATVVWYDCDNDVDSSSTDCNSTNAYGTITFQQNSDGQVTGTYSPAKYNGCQDTFSLAGSADGNGQFSLSFKDEGTGFGCYSSISASVTIAALGCATATALVKAAGSIQFQTDWNDGANGVAPTGETAPASVSVVPGEPATAQFFQNLEPTTYNFEGREVTESFPNGQNDGCASNPGSPMLYPPGTTTFYPLVDSVPNNNMRGNGVTVGYNDRVGLSTIAVNQIRAAGDAPCTISLTQHLLIDTPSGVATYQYQQNYITITVNQATMISIRNGYEIEWNYISPADIVLPPVGVSLLLR